MEDPTRSLLRETFAVVAVVSLYIYDCVEELTSSSMQSSSSS
jgi:hypothetical protein